MFYFIIAKYWDYIDDSYTVSVFKELASCIPEICVLDSEEEGTELF